MIYINKGEEPEWLREFKKKFPKATYDSKEFKQYIPVLNDVLIREQKGLCAYCCCSIDTKTAHNEHIEPRHFGGHASEKSLDYNNLVASCFGFKGERTCGPKKDNDYDANRFVSPLNMKCESVFAYYPNGEIDGDEYTIELLNLNSFRLKQARESVYKELEKLDLDMINQIYPEDADCFGAFYDVVRWYVDNKGI